jgi:hypothetical protein
LEGNGMEGMNKILFTTSHKTSVNREAPRFRFER